MNKKYIIIFGTLILLLIIIIGGFTYYKDRVKINYQEETEKTQDTLALADNYPISSRELLDFIDVCSGAPFIEQLENDRIREAVCYMDRISPELYDQYGASSDKEYVPHVIPLRYVAVFNPNTYGSILVSLEDILAEYNINLLEKDLLYFCSVSEPSWADPRISLIMEEPQTLIFEEGDISCAGVNINAGFVTMFYGFIPSAESLNIKEYLVDEQTVSAIMSKQQSFSEMKEILNDYPVIWQTEKPINL